MSFADEITALPWNDWLETGLNASISKVRETLKKPRLGIHDFAALISPAASGELETMCRHAMALTHRRFGKVIRLFAPLYLSNECINNCRYCGFAHSNRIRRRTLDYDEVEREAAELYNQGFRNVLLVAGEHPKLVASGYIEECVQRMKKHFSSIGLEVGPMDTSEYRRLVEAGADGLTIYQETYDQQTYSTMHPSGPKSDFKRRLETPERAGAAGFRRIGIGALLGLADWRAEALLLAAHAEYLLKHCWKSQLTISVPRLRPHAGRHGPLTSVSDSELVQLVAALRLFLPDVGLVLSTREKPRLRDGLIRIGITLISAGSHTEPGGYTGAGSQTYPEPVPAVNQSPPAHPAAATADHATAQFEIADHRSPREIAELIQRLGYEPVWKDWDTAFGT
ncbi:MAG: 2-iminoacetate synthase ThiH [Verrucomicrobia bacterium]|nr:2-iminoacetate synthase ThiH [Verrucomicrobiota bacterium]MCF7708475.1 2-iminoacetate synthase ThiH [Verrucomicrobiota bacterium]